MVKCVLHSDFYDLDMDHVDIILEYFSMDTIDTINIIAKKKYLKLWYKKNKIKL